MRLSQSERGASTSIRGGEDHEVSREGKGKKYGHGAAKLQGKKDQLHPFFLAGGEGRSCAQKKGEKRGFPEGKRGERLARLSRTLRRRKAFSPAGRKETLDYNKRKMAWLQGRATASLLSGGKTNAERKKKETASSLGEKRDCRRT